MFGLFFLPWRVNLRFAENNTALTRECHKPGILLSRIQLLLAAESTFGGHRRWAPGSTTDQCIHVGDFSAYQVVFYNKHRCQVKWLFEAALIQSTDEVAENRGLTTPVQIKGWFLSTYSCPAHTFLIQETKSCRTEERSLLHFSQNLKLWRRTLTVGSKIILIFFWLIF